ncbi:MAG: GTPase [Lachnospiraceae bacterium]|nr:GTPase [Lachnospiraceae bacterium]
MKSVFVINGFLDGGKTQFISYTLSQPYFKTKGTTLLVVCEEGEEEYDDMLLKATNTVKVVVEDESEIAPDKLIELDKKYKPSRIIFEYNGMWNFKNFKLPFLWKLEQQITLFDATSFELYYANMRSLLAEMVKKSELIIFNRCDNLTAKLPGFKRNIKALNQMAEIVFEDKDGEVNMTLEEELPYDVTKDSIELTEETYGIWYLDILDNLDRYLGKTISFTANVLVPGDMAKGYFVPGRMIMTCCAEDIQFLGLPCKYDGASELEDRSWVNITVKVAMEYFEGYKAEGPMLICQSITPCKAPKNEVLSFS